MGLWWLLVTFPLLKSVKLSKAWSAYAAVDWKRGEAASKSPNHLSFFLVDLGRSDTEISSSDCPRFLRLWLQRQTGKQDGTSVTGWGAQDGGSAGTPHSWLHPVHLDFPFLRDHITTPYSSRPASWKRFCGIWGSRTAGSTFCLMIMETLLRRSCSIGQWNHRLLLCS